MGNHLSTLPKTMAGQGINKKRSRKQERMENMEAKNWPNGRTLTKNTFERNVRTSVYSYSGWLQN